MSISLVVVAPDGQLAAMLRRAGHSARETSLEQLAEAAADSRPSEVLVVDLRGCPTLPTGLARVKRRHSNTPIVVIAARLDPAVMLEAMRMGVNEFLSEPVTITDLEAAFVRVVGDRAGGPGGQVFAFVGAKGGVGTTTLAVNVAMTLSMLSAGRTLFLDLHLTGGDAAVFLGVEPKFSVIDALENAHRLDESFFRSLVARGKSGPDLLASSEHLVATPFETPRIRSLIEFTMPLYRFVVLDVSPLNPMVLDALDPASAIIVVTSQEVASVRSGSRLWSALSQRYGREKTKVVVGRANSLTELSRKDIERALGTGIRHEIPNDYQLALQAVNSGRPLAMENHNQLAASISELARELAGLEADKGNRERGAGFFGRLAGRRR
jgi:pilus assembly protein CpaE